MTVIEDLLEIFKAQQRTIDGQNEKQGYRHISIRAGGKGFPDAQVLHLYRCQSRCCSF